MLKGFAQRQNLLRYHWPVLLIPECSHKHFKVAEVTSAQRARGVLESTAALHQISGQKVRQSNKAIRKSINTMSWNYQKRTAKAQGGKSLLWPSQSLRCHTAKCRGRTAMLNPGILTASYHLLTRVTFILLSLVESQPGAFPSFVYFLILLNGLFISNHSLLPLSPTIHLLHGCFHAQLALLSPSFLSRQGPLLSFTHNHSQICRLQLLQS